MIRIIDLFCESWKENLELLCWLFFNVVGYFIRVGFYILIIGFVIFVNEEICIEWYIGVFSVFWIIWGGIWRIKFGRCYG